MNKHLARILVAVTAATITMAQPIASYAVNSGTDIVQQDQGSQETTAERTYSFVVDGEAYGSSQTIKSGETLTQPETPTKEGYAFKGWYADGSEDAYDFSQTIAFDAENAGNVTLTAKFEEEKQESETAPAAAERTYVFQNGDSTTEQTVKSGERLTKPEDPSEDGKVFEGWYSEDGTEFTDFDTELTFEETTTVTLNARFRDMTEEEKSIQAVYEKLMAAETLDELNKIEAELTEKEQSLMDRFSDAQNRALTKLSEKLGAYSTGNADTSSDYTVEVGSTVTLTGSGSGKNVSNHSWSSSDTGIVTVSSGNGWEQNNTATVTGVKEGTATITHNYTTKSKGSSKTHKETFTVTVNKATGTDSSSSGDKVKVYVYVASSGFSDEMYDLLKVDKSTLDGNGYFPAGSIEVDKSFFTGKSTTPGTGLISNASDWQKLLNALGDFDNQALTATAQPTAGTSTTVDYTVNNGNTVGEYISQAYVAYGSGWGTQSTALFHWHNTATWGTGTQHYGFIDQTVQYHLDLKFNTKTITFITGKNGITTPDYAKDGTTVDSRTYITGSEIQDPRNLKIPDGYQFMGYYKDADFKEEWDGIGTKLNEDQTVYIKITAKENTILKYVVAKGEGSVTPTEEAFNPEIGTWTGSTAQAADGYTFEGWYSDKECTQKLSDSASYKPVKPDNGWESGKTYYYYAKFVPANKNLTITKTLSGNMYDAKKSFAFKITADKAFSVGDTTYETGSTYETNLGKDGTVTISIPQDAAVIVLENPDGYTQSISSATYGDESSKLDYSEKTDGNYKGITFTMPSGDTKVTFDNNKDAVPDTGVVLDTLPYILILAVVAVGVVIFVKKRGKHSDD